MFDEKHKTTCQKIFRNYHPPPAPRPLLLPLYLTKNRLRSERYRCMWCKTLSTNNICLCVALPMYINRRDRRDRRDHRFWPWWPPVVKGGQWPIKNVQKQSEFSGFSEFSEFDRGNRLFRIFRIWLRWPSLYAPPKMIFGFCGQSGQSWPVVTGKNRSGVVSRDRKKRSVVTGRDR